MNPARHPYIKIIYMHIYICLSRLFLPTPPYPRRGLPDGVHTSWSRISNGRGGLVTVTWTNACMKIHARPQVTRFKARHLDIPLLSGMPYAKRLDLNPHVVSQATSNHELALEVEPAATPR